MKDTFIYWSLLYVMNSLVLIIFYLYFKKNKKFRQLRLYLIFMAIIFLDAIYLIVDFSYLENYKSGILFPFEVLYSPLIFFTVHSKYFTQCNLKKVYHILPFVFMGVFFGFVNQFPTDFNITYYSLALNFITGSTFLFYALWLFKHKLRTCKLDFKYRDLNLLSNVIYIMILLAFLNFGRLYYRETSNIDTIDFYLVQFCLISLASILITYWTFWLNGKSVALRGLGADRFIILNGKENKSKDRKYSKSRIDDELLETLKQKFLLIDEKIFLDPDFSLNYLESLLGINRHYLSQMFRFKFNTTFTVYVNDIRLKHAEYKLSNPGLEASVSDIALDSGFKTERTFYRVFKAKHNITPNQFRLKSLKSDLKDH